MITLKDYMPTLTNRCPLNGNCGDCILKDACTANFYSTVIQEYNITPDTTLRVLITSVLKALNFPNTMIEDVNTVFLEAGEE